MGYLRTELYGSILVVAAEIGTVRQGVSSLRFQ